MTTYFTHTDSWTGGFYELAINVGSVTDEAIFAVLEALWSYPTLEGCYVDRQREPSSQTRLLLTPELLQYPHLQGVAQLADGARLACGTYLLRHVRGTDWANFYLPAGALEQVYDLTGYPFSVRDNEPVEQWQQSLDQWLADLGSYVYKRTPYRFAVIGHEIPVLEALQLEEEGIPQQRWMGYLWPKSETLTYWPRTQP